MFLLVCQGFLLPQNQEIELDKCESFLVTCLPERKREPLLTENVLENICLGSGPPPPPHPDLSVLSGHTTWGGGLLTTETAPNFSLE